MPEDPFFYPLLNACLNGIAGLLLVIGFVFIKQGKESAHKRMMISAFTCSIFFLASYLYYHLHFEVLVKYAGAEWGATPYFVLLGTHTILASVVPVLAIVVIRAGLKNNRKTHRKWAKILFPIWVYVSITGVLIYLILYVFTPSAEIAITNLQINSLNN